MSSNEGGYSGRIRSRQRDPAAVRPIPVYSLRDPAPTGPVGPPGDMGLLLH